MNILGHNQANFNLLGICCISFVILNTSILFITVDFSRRFVFPAGFVKPQIRVYDSNFGFVCRERIELGDFERMNSLGFGVGDISGQSNREDIASILAIARRHLNGGNPAAALQAVSGATGT